MKRPRLLVLVAATAVAVSTGVGSAALAAPPSPERTVGPNHDVQGLVPAHAASRTAGAGGNLLYHSGGSVMTTNTTYAVYWNPGGFAESTAYRSTINQFLGDVAADSGKTSNVYYSDTQYYQNIGGTQNIQYKSTFGGSFNDTDAYPASGCTDPVAETTVCLTDVQLQTELSAFINLNGLPRGIGYLYFIFTPQGVGSCIASNECAFSYYCAYHSHIGSGSSVVLYANQPYTETVDADCGSGRSPNGDPAADSTINVASHEHNEAITDALGNAWFDRRGAENGDKCAWNFGTGTSGGNQTINGHSYYLQQEWSNKHSGCVLTGT